MTSEQRLDRLERIALLMVRGGARVRREQNEKINIIIDAQFRNEDRFATLAGDLARSHNVLAQSIVGLHTELAQTQNDLAQSIVGLHTELAQTQNDLAGKLAHSHNELAQSLNVLAKAQTRTENRLDSLIEIITRDRNGNPG